jgi:hypothetical protein
LPVIDTRVENNMGDITPNVIKHNNILGTHTSSSVILDSINFPKIDMIKIDVQGYELFVLEGGKNLINKDRPIIIIEIEEHQLNLTNVKIKELIEYIENLNYYIFYLDYIYPSDHICVPVEQLEEFENIFKEYINPHIEYNSINYNINFGIDRKIKMNY